MRTKPYYSVRTGKNPKGGPIDLKMLTRQILSIYNLLDNWGYFQEDLGYDCVDSGFVPGKLGYDLEAVVSLELRKPDLLPIRTKLKSYSYSEDDLFDILEFLYEHCSAPIPNDDDYHSYNDCGWHYSAFDREKGKREFREKVNPLLEIYSSGFELSEAGEILEKTDVGFEKLLEAPLPSLDPENIEARVAAARTKFRRHKSSLDDRRQAIRDLADVLEFLRPKVKSVLTSKDEDDLFNIVNNFGIRHHNASQKVNYDKAIWYSWLFYFYLATIHAVLRLIAKEKEKGNGSKVIKRVQ